MRKPAPSPRCSRCSSWNKKCLKNKLPSR
ncbi:MAG: hypothetical protein E7200_02880 [Selenomonas ruminantium]|nr:hypothetical protein [Selenomonas ruminantium]